MKVTVDTRHDSLEGALAAVRAAFGSTGNSQSDGRRDSSRTVADGAADAAKPARTASVATARPAAKSAPAKSTAAARASKRNRRKSTDSRRPTSNIAPPGQADAIRAWAKAQGMEVKQAGRLPGAVIRAYQESSAS